jgi:hypothetical protein
MQDNPRLQVPRFDLPGYLFLAFGMVAVSLAVDGLSGLGLKQASVLVLLVFGMASLTAYWLHAAKRPDPCFRPSCFPFPRSASACSATCSRAWAAHACLSWCPAAAGVSLDYSPLQAGMMMVPVAVASMLVKRVTTPLITRYGYRRCW